MPWARRFTQSLLAQRGIIAMAVVAIAICVDQIYLRVRAVNPIDWLVYRYGSDAAWNGVDVYTTSLHGAFIDQPDGMPFTYTPFAALMLWPTNIGSQTVAFSIWTVLTAVALFAVIWICTPRTASHRTAFVFCAWIAASATTMVSIHLAFGQVNIFLMLLVIVDFARSPVSPLGRRLPRGLLIGVAAAVKLTPLLFIVYLAVIRDWKMFWWSMIGCAGCTLAALLIAPELSWSFFGDGLWNLDSTAALGTTVGSASNNSIQGLLTAIGLDRGNVGTAIAAAVAVAGLLVARAARVRSGVLAGAVVVGLTASFVSPISWVHHWVYLIPAAVILWQHRGRRTKAAIAASALITVIAWPRTGQHIIDHAHAALLPAGWVLREMLMVLALLAIAGLAWRRRPHRSPGGGHDHDRSLHGVEHGLAGGSEQHRG